MRKVHSACLLVLLPLLSLAQWNASSSINTPVCIANDKQQDLRIIKDGKGGAYIVWKDYRTSGIPDVYMQRLNSNGMPKWATNGIPICTNSADQSTPALVSDGKGGAIVTWSDWRSGIERDLYAQRVDSNGNILWAVDGVIVTNKTAREHNPKISEDNAGGAIITWEQQTGGLWDIWAQRINANGAVVWASGGIPMCTVTANRLNPKIQEDGKGGAIIVWQDERNGTYDIYAQRVTASGVIKWGSGGLMICNAPDVQTDPKIDPDTTIGGAYVVWIDSRSGTNYDLYAQRVDSSGNLKWAANGIAVVSVSGNQTAQDLLSNGSTGGVIITWKDKRNGTDYDIYAQKLSAMGAPMWGASGIAVCNSAKSQVNPNIVQDEVGGAIILWQDSSAGNYDIRAQRLNSAGQAQWAAGGVAVGTAADNQVSAKNIPDGKGGSIFAFQDKRSGAYDIYAHHLYSNGTVINGINDEEVHNRIICYPNPFRSDITLIIPSKLNDIISVTGYNILGKEIDALRPERTVSQGNTSAIYINTASKEIAPGIYLIRINTAAGSQVIQVIKKD